MFYPSRWLSATATKCFDLSGAYRYDIIGGKYSVTLPRGRRPNYSIAQISAIALKQSAFTIMSHTLSASASSSKFQVIISNSLDTYRKRTKRDLLTHPLASRLQACDTPAAILTIIREQIHGLGQSQSGAERWSKWLDPTVNVLFAFSATIGAGVGLVCVRTCTHSRSAS